MAPRAYVTVKCPRELKTSSEAVAAQAAEVDEMLQCEAWGEAVELDGALAEHAGQDGGATWSDVMLLSLTHNVADAAAANTRRGSWWQAIAWRV